MKLSFKKNCDDTLISTVEWMLGYSTSAPYNWRFSNWNKSKRRLSSPLSHYLREIERFSFDRGPHFDLTGDGSNDPKQRLIEEVLDANHADSLVYASHERGAVTGGVYWFFRPDVEKGYRLYLFDNTEVCRYPEDSGIKGFMVQVKGLKGWQRWGFTDRAYVEYLDTKNPRSDWVEKSSEPHPYGFVPGVEILNQVKDHTLQGSPTFDWMAVEMAIEICAQTLSSAANFNYFGGPFLVSSDPKETLKELLSRSQVLTGSQDNQLQDTELLSMPAMPEHHKDFVDGLAKNFSDHLGISWVPDTPPGDTSSLTLRLLHAKTINRAEKAINTYLGGFRKLLGLILVAGAFDGVVVGVSMTNPETFDMGMAFNHNVFPLTPLEKTQILGVVEQLQGLGIRTEVALSEYYPDRTEDQIIEMMIGA